MHMLTHKLLALPHRPARSRRSERGQSLVEFSLFVVFLSVLLAGVVDLGRVYFTYLALKDAAGEGAYFGTAYPTCTDDTVRSNPAYQGCQDPNNIEYRVINSNPQGGMVNWSSATVTTTLPSTIEPGQLLTVSVSADYQLITPFVGAIVGEQSLPLGARSVAVIVRVPDCSQPTGCQ